LTRASASASASVLGLPLEVARLNETAYDEWSRHGSHGDVCVSARRGAADRTAYAALPVQALAEAAAELRSDGVHSVCLDALAARVKPPCPLIPRATCRRYAERPPCWQRASPPPAFVPTAAATVAGRSRRGRRVALQAVPPPPSCP
jgi:hypothetical protein